MKEQINNRNGFTLVELMIAIAIMIVVMAAVFSSYHSQQFSRKTQSLVAEMQQNLRAAMIELQRAIREAGSDGKFVSGAGIVVAAPGQIRITRDIAGHPVNPNEADGDVNDNFEDVIYGFNPAFDTDAVPDGILDAGPPTNNFCRNNVNDGTNIFQPIAEGIEQIEFNYLDTAGNPIPTPIVSASDLNRIAMVQVSLLVRTHIEDPDRSFLNTSSYTTASGNIWGPYGDRFRRRLAITSINCRNSF